MSIGNKRKQGYLKALADHQLPAHETLIVEGSNDEEKDINLVQEMFVREKPDGIFAAVERYAMAAYEVCGRLQLHIPQDVKVISFSNLRIAAYLNPSLTTIAQPAFDIGKEAASRLLTVLEKKNAQLPNESLIFKSSLIQRASTSK
ncbi:substrate-binding domain-containing protein [Paraflavitalea speifideaquila]|uniref:substrate-binding domain-containing protein n=1 Tax=Paraflavitalea speifideaquila TaxID=3076558 RepID=UPI0028E52859|nr:substrate-binding domain-containing protein [Paraflavitalea speifideiaquila]